MENNNSNNTENVFEIERNLDTEAGFFTRFICALLSFIIPGLGQALQQRYLRTFDFLIFYGTCMVASLIFSIHLFRGISLAIVMFSFFALPSVVAFFDALLNKSNPGDADTIVRSIFLFIFFYILTLGPFHFLYNIVGYKMYRLKANETQLEPILFPNDVVIFDLDAYGIRTPGIKITGAMVEVGDIVCHETKSKNTKEKKRSVHIVLASPGDTLVSSKGKITVNGRQVKLPLTSKFSGGADFGPIVVPKDELFLVDNSQEFFPIFLKAIIGKAEVILISKEKSGGFRWDRFGKHIGRVDILLPEYIPKDTSIVITDSVSLFNDLLPDSLQ